MQRRLFLYGPRADEPLLGKRTLLEGEGKATRGPSKGFLLRGTTTLFKEGGGVLFGKSERTSWSLFSEEDTPMTYAVLKKQRDFTSKEKV